MSSAPAGLLLWHGAGGDRDHRHFVAIEEALEIPVRRVNFAFRLKGPRQPPARAAALVEEISEVVPQVAEEMGVEPGRLLLGGRSMGGRVASMAVAQGLEAAGLVLLSYPLHPPKKPENLRVGHFGALDLPVLFVSGDRDPFGRPDEWTRHLATIPGEVTFEWLEAANHDPKKNEDVLVRAVANWVDQVGSAGGKRS